MQVQNPQHCMMHQSVICLAFPVLLGERCDSQSMDNLPQCMNALCYDYLDMYDSIDTVTIYEYLWEPLGAS